MLNCNRGGGGGGDIAFFQKFLPPKSFYNDQNVKLGSTLTFYYQPLPY